MANPPRDLLVSVDVEADGPVPLLGSMLSIGMAICGTRDARGAVEAVDPAASTFYAELRPICDAFSPESLAVSGLDRDALARDGRDPAEAMEAARAWVEAAGRRLDAQPIFCAFPLGFDWMWAYWYFVRFAVSPFGHSRHLDMKTLYAARAGTAIRSATKRQMPSSFFDAGRPHTHNALDDAIEQGLMLQRMLAWTPAAR